jgi:hypothetical protein
MSLLRFNWTDEVRYRRRFRALLRHAQSIAILCLDAGLDHVFLSDGYQQVVERTYLGLDPVQHQEVYLTSLSYIQSWALLLVAGEVAPAQLGRSLFLHQSEILWIDYEGEKFVADTVFAVINGMVLVATAEEFPLDENYLVDRQLFRTEVAHIGDQIQGYRKLTGEF